MLTIEQANLTIAFQQFMLTPNATNWQALELAMQAYQQSIFPTI